jgi:hypothetical protein
MFPSNESLFYLFYWHVLGGFISNKVVQLIIVYIYKQKYFFAAYIYIPTNWLLLLMLSFIFAKNLLYKYVFYLKLSRHILKFSRHRQACNFLLINNIS